MAAARRSKPPALRRKAQRHTGGALARDSEVPAASRPAAAAPAMPAAGVPAEVALPMLLDRYGPRLYAVARRMCGNPHDAEDMVQEVFLRAYRKWGQFRGAADPGTWLYAIAARSCKERFRRRGGADRRVPSFSQLAPWAERTVAALPARPDASLERQQQREAQAALQELIVRLPESFRLPLLFKEVFELSLREVADVLGLKPQTVKTRVHRARLLLRRAIGARLPQRPAPAPRYEQQVCLDLLNAKLEAMDRGRNFPLRQEIVCERCRAVLAELDLAQETCAGLAEGVLPAAVRTRLMKHLRPARSAGRRG